MARIKGQVVTCSVAGSTVGSVAGRQHGRLLSVPHQVVSVHALHHPLHTWVGILLKHEAQQVSLRLLQASTNAAPR